MIFHFFYLPLGISVSFLCILKCVIPENIHTSPMEGSFSKTPSLEIPIKLHTFL